MRAAILLLWIALIGAGVWWMVTRLPLAEPPAPAYRRPAHLDSPLVRTNPPASAPPAPVAPVPASPAEILPTFLPELTAPCGSRCGVQRWAVKTLSDADRARVHLVPVDATVEQLGRLPRPARLPADRRAGPVELATYRVTGCLGILDREPESDGDIHVVIGGLEDRRLSMVTEIPNASCGGVCQSGLGAYYARARATLDSILAAGVVSPACNNDVPLVTIVGVGFFDRNHGQRGAAPNFIELHPVLSLTLAR